jgi:uncharacterized membrane protein
MQTGKTIGRGIGWFIFGLLSIGIGLYPLLYFFVDRNFGLLSTKPPGLLKNIFWNIGFYTHIICGGLALLVGWTQFIVLLRTRYLRIHRFIGKVYVLSAMLSAAVGVAIGTVATGGFAAAAGFVCLGITWFTTTLVAFLRVKEGKIAAHQKWMIFSYAACFAAVTLRIWLPLLSNVTGDFNTAYRVVAWLCWVPNMIVAYFLSRGIPGDTIDKL